jgi:hypothetical protein
MADTPVDTLVWTRPPAGDKRPEKVTASGARRVDEIKATGKDKGKAQLIDLRHGENGPVRVRAWCRRVWLWPKDTAQPIEQWLVVSEDANGDKKYSLSNLPATAALERLVRLQRQRYFVERTFQDAKTHLGMAQLQARKWRAWQHHKVLVALAQLFILQERLAHAEAVPLLSAADVGGNPRLALLPPEQPRGARHTHSGPPSPPTKVCAARRRKRRCF